MVLGTIATGPGKKVKLVGIHYVAKDYLVGIELAFFAVAIATLFIAGLALCIFGLRVLIAFVLRKRNNGRKQQPNAESRYR